MSNVCACCDDDAAHVLLGCLKNVCDKCLGDMRSNAPHTCFFCAESSCLPTAAVKATPKSVGVRVATCAAHGLEADFLCRACGGIRCRALCLGSSACPDGTRENTFWMQSLRATEQERLWARLHERRANYVELDPHYELLMQELRKHNDEQLRLLEDAFRPCPRACGRCDRCPTLAERAQHEALKQRMLLEGAADIKTLQCDREDAAAVVEKIDAAILQVRQANVRRRLLRRDVFNTKDAVLVLQCALALVRASKPSAPKPTHVSVVCAPQPFGHRTRTCTSLNRLFRRPRRDVACLHASKSQHHVDGMQALSIFENADGGLLLVGNDFSDSSKGRPMHHLDLDTNKFTFRLNLNCKVFGRLPNGLFVGFGSAARGESTHHLSCVDGDTGAVIWSHTGGEGDWLKLSVSPDGMTVVFWHKLGGFGSLRSSSVYELIAYLPDGTLHWRLQVDNWPAHMILLDRHHVAYAKHKPSKLFVHNVHTGAFSHTLDLPSIATHIEAKNVELFLDEGPCHADEHIAGCPRGCDSDFASLVNLLAPAPLYWWSENAFMRPVYLHDGRVVQYESTAMDNTFCYSLRTPSAQ